MPVPSICRAQSLRQDAFPPVEEPLPKAGLEMADNVDEMLSWDRYPTYPAYLAMLIGWSQQYPQLCDIEYIGTSCQGRMILALHIHGTETPADAPQFFYSSTIHGDEITGFQLMLHLCDSLLSAYGSQPDITRLLNTTHIYINPLANPDGTYFGGNNTVAQSRRYNANRIDLNRNYPDPFGTPPLDPVQQENLAMIEYVSQHHFLMAANIHGGDQVVNLPWDSFTSRQQMHPDADWLFEIGQRFVDSCRGIEPEAFSGVCSSGVIVGGDWYVIHNGRQDYMNECLGIREVTLEISSAKRLASSQLPQYWKMLGPSLIHYISEIHSMPGRQGIEPVTDVPVRCYPNPTTGPVTLEHADETRRIDLSPLPAGTYAVPFHGHTFKIIKL